MEYLDIDLLEKKINEIYYLIIQAIKIGFIPDRSYESIKEKIGKIDVYRLDISNYNQENSRAFELINQADAIYKILDKARSSEKAITSSITIKTTGDYVKDDNSFTLSQKTKEDLQAILDLGFNQLSSHR